MTENATMTAAKNAAEMQEEGGSASRVRILFGRNERNRLGELTPRAEPEGNVLYISRLSLMHL